MRLQALFYSRGGYAATLALLAGSGVTLILSMPWAGRVADFFLFPWRPTPIAFLFALAAFGAIHAVNRGAAVEPLPRIQRRHLLSLPLQVALAQVLVLPYVAVCTVLFPSGNVGFLWLAWAYLGLVNVALAALSFVVSVRCFRRAVHPFMPLLLCVAVCSFLPLFLHFAPDPVRVAALLSPAEVVWRLLNGPVPGGRLLLSFVAPAAVGLALILVSLRRIGREIHGSRP